MSQHSSVAGASRPVKEAGFFTKIKNVACLKSSSSSDKGKGGKGKSKSSSNKVSHGFHLVEGQSGHKMEDYHVAEYRKRKNHTLGLFAIFDGHLGDRVPTYLKDNLFNNILEEPNFWKDPEAAIRSAYSSTDKFILDNSMQLGPGGSTAVTAIVIDGKDLWVANIGDSRAVVCERGSANQITVDHEPHAERRRIEKQGGFVTTLPGDVPRVNGQLAVARAFGDQSLKAHLSSEPDVRHVPIDSTIDFVILASDGLWKARLLKHRSKKSIPFLLESAFLNVLLFLTNFGEFGKDHWFLIKVMKNEEAVNLVKTVKDPQAAAKLLTTEALARKSKDDISCIVIRFG